MKPGTSVRITSVPWAGRTGTVVESSPKDLVAWPEYARVKLDHTVTDLQPQLVERAHLEPFQRAGQLGLFGGVA